MNKVLRTIYSLTKHSVLAFLDDKGLQKSAALAYYTIFALPGLLIIVLSIAGLAFDARSIDVEVIDQVRLLLGETAAKTIETIITNVRTQTANLSVTAILGLIGLLFGATGAFAELQNALNEIWGVRPDPKRNDLYLFVRKRLLSFGMILSIGFILLVSLTLSTLFSIIGTRLNTLLPNFLLGGFLNGLELVLSLMITSVLFAALFKMLPDALVAWRDVGIGAFVTAVAFAGGKELIGLYLGNSNIGSAFGAASSLAVLLVWVYFFGFARAAWCRIYPTVGQAQR